MSVLVELVALDMDALAADCIACSSMSLQTYARLRCNPDFRFWGMSLMRVTRRVATSAAASLVLLAGVGVAPSTAATVQPKTETVRLAGTDRYATAAAIAKATYPNAQQTVVTMARGDAFPDALSAANI